jgi:hypothetical protein
MDDWESTWAPMVARVGEDFANGVIRWGADLIEAGAVRRYVEVLEFDCPLHQGPDAVAPSTSLASFTLPAMWPAGQPPVFTSDARNAEPERSPLKGTRPEGMPPTTAYMATDYEVDYLQPARRGDRLGRRGNRLVRCEPKATKVGRGAFTTWEYDIVNQREEVVARCRFGMYHYLPH